MYHQLTIWEAMEQQEQTKRVYCRRCGRELKSAKAKELGFGPSCYTKYMKELTLNNRKRLFNVDTEV